MMMIRRRPLMTAVFASLMLILCFAGLFLALLNATQEAEEPSAPTLSPQFPDYAEALRLSLFPEPIALSPVELPTTLGTPYDFAAPTSPVTLVYFGFTNCPDFCPSTLANITRVYNALDESQQQKVTTLMVTVDPERDTIERLTQYLAGFREGFIGVRAADDAAQTNLVRQFGVAVIPRQIESELGYTVDHTTSLFLVDGQGRVLGRYPYDTPASDISEDIRLILAQEGT